MADDDAFHEGERLVQSRVGVRARMAQIGGRLIRGAMPDMHRELFEKLPYLFVGSVDRGRPIASVLVGAPGFVVTPDDRTMVIAARPTAGDALLERLPIGAAIGVLGIELHTRRRNRMNGTVIARNDDAIAVRVAQSFGNCPQYIQARAPISLAPLADRAVLEPQPAVLSSAAASLVARADTAFVASASKHAEVGGTAEGVDVSHRGGRPGFVRVTREGDHSVLTMPDFAGNQFFNTLGNLTVRPAAGLLFIDFASGDVLQLATDAEIVFDGDELDAFEGAQRLVRFTVHSGLLARGAVPLRWSPPELAPQLARTGEWTSER